MKHRKAPHIFSRGWALPAACALTFLTGPLTSDAQVAVKKEDIKGTTYAFQAPGAQLENVGGAVDRNENIGFQEWTFPDGEHKGSSIYYLYADSRSKGDKASLVLKWDFSKSGHQVTEVEIPQNRLYYQYEPSSTVEEALAVISYSVDGKEWTELDQFNPDVTTLTAEVPVKAQNNPLYVALDKPTSVFYYRVEFQVKGGPFFGQAFQWERMGLEPAIMRPDHFAVNFTVAPAR
jgi:hypothetical protein